LVVVGMLASSLRLINRRFIAYFSTKADYGRLTTSSMLEWRCINGWSEPIISAVHNVTVSPASNFLHYASACTDGFTVHWNPSQQAAFAFQLPYTIARLHRSSTRMALPPFDESKLQEQLKKLIKTDLHDISTYNKPDFLYLQVNYVATEPRISVSVSSQSLLTAVLYPYTRSHPSSNEYKPLKLWSESEYVHAWPGGTGQYSSTPNYAPTLYVRQKAKERNCDDVLWLFGEQKNLAGVGIQSSVFVLLSEKDGSKTLVTPPLENGLTYPCEVRAAVIALANEKGGSLKVVEREMSDKEFTAAIEQQRILEVFATDPLQLINRVSEIHHGSLKTVIPTPKNGISVELFEQLQSIQFGETNGRGWTVKIG